MAEPRNPTLLRLRDWPMFRRSPATRMRQRKASDFEGRPLPRISELLMSHMEGTPSEKIAWLEQKKATGMLDGDDPEEVAEAEALLRMLARIAEPKERKHHLDELLDEALRTTFPASDPVSVGRFTSTEPR